jgi:hypothetical protein
MTIHDLIGYGGFSLVAGALLTVLKFAVRRENREGIA